ncbi:macrolide family glycosyltransferase [Streptococcus orisasini]|uniref:macrolide family glycosyltransferase n=1 Tax=Streptococcus orisasini TaxID=1080071 RepID=UPI00070FAFC2|nr:macrolide family glycosyltransferase [Streptococcus orisasini]
MKRIIFMGVPAFGHTNPTLFVVQKLVENGHQVRYYTVSNFKESLEKLGAEVICYDEKMAYMTVEHVNQPTHNQKNHFSALLAIVSEAIEDIRNTYLEEIRVWQPDVIVGDSLALWASVIADNLDVPYVSYNTHFAFNEYTPTMLSDSSFKDNFKMLLHLPEMMANYHKIKRLGYPSKHVTDLALTRTDCPVIVTTSQNFQPAGASFCETIHFVGPVIRESTAVWKKSNRPLVYISLGTVNNQASDFYRHCFTALGNKEFDVLLSVGAKTDINSLGQIPQNFQVAHSFDQIAVLKSADVFLTHCGLNSTSEALYYEVPLLVFPQTIEQNMVAEQVLAAGAGFKLESYAPTAIAQGIEEVLYHANYKKQASKVAQDFRASGGVEAAMQIILNPKQ